MSEDEALDYYEDAIGMRSLYLYGDRIYYDYTDVATTMEITYNDVG